MEPGTQTAADSKTSLWAGWTISALAGLFLLFDGIMKLVKPAIVVETTVKLGYPESFILGLGLVLIACTIIYLNPGTSVLGAILLTGYLGGAVATHVRAGDPLFPVSFPIIFGMLIWGALYLRDARLRALVPVRSHTQAAVSNKMLWVGWIVSALPVLMLVFSGVMKLLKPATIVEGFTHLGYDESLALGLGIVELGCAAVYVIPGTSVLGAILLTGYLGGAVATHVRIGETSQAFGPVVVGVLVWVGLYLRDVRLRTLVPLRS
jgi:hypothetical protein